MHYELYYRSVGQGDLIDDHIIYRTGHSQRNHNVGCKLEILDYKIKVSMESDSDLKPDSVIFRRPAVDRE